MSDSLEIQPISGPIHATIRPPGSKSITNRALVCAALADGDSTLTGALDSEDTQVMIAALGTLGIRVDVQDRGRALRVRGCGGIIPSRGAELFVANSGTTMRFLTAMVTLAHGEFTLDGVPRMRERPIADLIKTLRDHLDGRIEDNEGFPPITVHSDGLKGGHATISGDVSSQFLSGLLMVAPYARAPMDITILGPLVSTPYVKMTLSVMQAFGATVETPSGIGKIFVSNIPYIGRKFDIEPDASAASYFFAAAAICGGRIRVEGLNSTSIQGDVRFCDCLKRMGATIEEDHAKGEMTVIGPGAGETLRGIKVDMNSISDTVPTLAVTALFAQGATTISNVAHIRDKETDRIAAVVRELRKLGAEVEEFDDGMRINPRPLHGAAIDTYQDHRMAMSFALAGLRIPGVVIRDPACVGKTYPDYFADLDRVVGR